MDRIEQLFREHRASFDREEPHPGMWERLNGSLNHAASNTFGKGWMLSAAMLVIILISAFIIGMEEKHVGIKGNQTFPNIVMQSPQGESRSLSDLKGKVVLVEFWASWCNVCSEKNCNDLLPLYDIYKERGFEIFAISVDEDHRQWLNGIESYHLPWIHVSDLQGFASPVSQRFEVNQTPTTYLLDEERKVIGKNLTRQDLEMKLRECYGE